MKRYYNTRKEARVAIEGTSLGYKVWRVTFGRHKGQYFVGTELEWFSI